LTSSDATDHAFEMIPPELAEDRVEQIERHPHPDAFWTAAREWLGFLLVEHGAIAERRAVAHTLFRERHRLHVPESGDFTLAEMRARALREAERSDPWMGAFASHAAELGARRFALWEKCEELAGQRRGSRLPADIANRLGALASEVLDDTSDAYAELGVRSWSAMLSKALGADAPGEWPARLSTRTLADLLGAKEWFDGLSPEAFEVPRVLGASTVMRGLWALGRALHDASSNPRLPFVLAREPQAQRSRATGALFALLPARAAFAERRLGVGRARLRDYRQRMALVTLVAVRHSALRALLAPELHRGGRARLDGFLELGERALGFEPAAALHGAIFASEHGLADFAGLLAAFRREHELTEKHDEDWFRNPRAAREIRADLEIPPPRTLEGATFEGGLAVLQHTLSRDL
ncbi:MAG TPA: hypothetical protein VIM73_14880, partial [Polyangiaceae bacterium]